MKRVGSFMKAAEFCDFHERFKILQLIFHDSSLDPQIIIDLLNAIIWLIFALD
ncbi:hypothetical protein CSC28_1188 [Pseudomonas paraeruginosa]|nr:hypothetical protein CSC28_1188 [Pseudomonas paraeruginosa]